MLAIPWFHSGKDSIFSFLKIVAVKFCQYLKHLQDALVFLYSGERKQREHQRLSS